MNEETRKLFNLEKNQVGLASLKDGEVVFPGKFNWSKVLDCTHEPFNERTLEENLKFAEHIHKNYILFIED